VDRPVAVPDPAPVASEASGSGKAGGPLARRLGAAVVAKRRILDITQEELAERSGLHRTYVASVERGRRNPSLDAIAQLASGLGIPMSELFRLVEAMGVEPLPVKRVE
jgi:transcriptional regulator with XRE-family HTH domain